MKKIIGLVVIVYIVYHYGFASREIKHGPGELATLDPVQENLGNAPAIQYKNYTITPMADFNITARVLSRENYSLDASSELSPMDLALGWGPMSDSQVLEKISISQSNRWYHWHVDEFPIPQRDIETHSANMHMIPADTSILNTLERVHTGDVVTLKGKLVSITRPDGWHWKSSMTREDTGDGACEVVYVESFYIKP
jgi:hypothetical protein